MSAEWQTQAGESWKLTVPCTQAEAEAIATLADPLPGFEPAPVLMTSEIDEDHPDVWQLDVYSEGAPSAGLIAAITALVPSAGTATPAIERIEDEDWVTRSQQWLRPIDAGRFHVHTAAHEGSAPPGSIAFHIEAGRAFGTGHHETTSGCLEMLDAIARDGGSFARIADIGTGTGLLAFAAQALWPAASILAADIDPVAVEVTAANMAANGIAPEVIALIAAPGVDHPRIEAAAPFDLILANILAGPLIDLAPSFAAVATPYATVILAGLLAAQEAAVVDGYQANGFELRGRLQKGNWSILSLRRVL